MKKTRQLYFQEIEKGYREAHSGTKVLVVGPKNIVDTTIKAIIGQLKAILKEGINIGFVTDFNYKGEAKKADKIDGISDNVSLIQIPFGDNRLIENSFEHAEQNGLSKIIILTRKRISGIMFGEKVDLNYINENILKKLTLDPKVAVLVNKIFELIKKSSTVERVHFVNILSKNSLSRELFTLYGGGDGDGILVSQDYQLELDKLSNASDLAIEYLHELLKELSIDGYVNYKTLEYIIGHIMNFYTLNIDGYPIGMFEVKPISNFTKEVGTVILDPHFQGGGIGYRVIEESMKLRESEQYIFFKFIMVTGNIFLKNIMAKFNKKEVNGIQDLFGDELLEERYEKMLRDNEKDGNNRTMYIY